MAKWCNYYNMWCDEVEENMEIKVDGFIYCDVICDLDCKNCENCKQVK